MSDIERAIKEAAEKAVLRIISEGQWIAPDYKNRFKLPPDVLNDIWRLVDIEAVKTRMRTRLENELADRIMNHLAAEIATDVKQILSVKERREALRSLAREHMEAIMAAAPQTQD